jgi:predicted dehydrogenase
MGATIDDEIRGHPHRTPTLPWAHAGGFRACDRTELVAVSDVDPAKTEAAQKRYDVPRGYADYRDMVRREHPDIVSVATRPATHAEITIFAAQHGVRAIYCEKPLCCSMAEADAMAAAILSNGVHFNYGTNRRFYPLFRKMRELLDAGELGQVQCVIAHCGTGVAQWWHTHTADLFCNMAGDADVAYVHGSLLVNEADWEGDRLSADPGIEMGFVRFRNGVRAYLTSATGYEFEVSGTKGKLRTFNDYATCSWRRYGEWGILEDVPFPGVPQESATVHLIRDLVEAMDTGRQTLGNIDVARRSQEIIFGFVESHRRGGARVPLPLENRRLYVGKAGW